MSNESQKSFPLCSLLLGILTIVFITLKLTGFIAWSWLWVFSPLWVLPLIFAVMVTVIFIISWIVGTIRKAVEK